MGGSTEVEVSTEMDGCAGVVGHAGVGDMQSQREYLQMVHLCEEEEGLAEASDSQLRSQGPDWSVGHNLHNLCQTFFLLYNPFLCCQSHSLFLFNPFKTDSLTPSSILSVPSPTPFGTVPPVTPVTPPQQQRQLLPPTFLLHLPWDT